MSTQNGASWWGRGIVVSFLLFVGAVVGMVAFTMSQRVDLVTETYYDQGLKYQERIDAARRGKVTIDLQGSDLALLFDRSVEREKPVGTVVLYRPADESRDVTIPIAVDDGGIQHISTAGLDRGLWRVKVEWKEGDAVRYHEEPVMIR